MIEKRSVCPLSSALEIFGDKWTLLIIRDIARFKKKHYKEFLQSHEGISTNILADRLKTLVEQNIIKKSPDPNNGLLIHYSLTEKGKDLLTVTKAIAAWGLKHIPGTEFAHQN